MINLPVPTSLFPRVQTPYKHIHPVTHIPVKAQNILNLNRKLLCALFQPEAPPFPGTTPCWSLVFISLVLPVPQLHRNGCADYRLLCLAHSVLSIMTSMLIGSMSVSCLHYCCTVCSYVNVLHLFILLSENKCLSLLSRILL